MASSCLSYYIATRLLGPSHQQHRYWHGFSEFSGLSTREVKTFHCTFMVGSIWLYMKIQHTPLFFSGGEYMKKTHTKKNSLAVPFVRGIHRWPVDSHHKGPALPIMMDHQMFSTSGAHLPLPLFPVLALDEVPLVLRAAGGDLVLAVINTIQGHPQVSFLTGILMEDRVRDACLR